MRRRVGARWFLAAGLVVTAVMAMVSLCSSPANLPQLPVGDVLQALGAICGLCDPIEATDQLIVEVLRVPRVLIAVFAGAALAIAGTVMQAVFRNPLASPEILGTAQGAALGATIAIANGWILAGVFAMPSSAIVGALLVTVLVYFIAGGPRGFSVSSLLLAGVAMNTLVGGLIAFYISKLSGDQWGQGSQILYWLMGDFEKATGADAVSVGVGLAVFAVVLIPFLRDLDVMTLHDEGARALGVNVHVVRSILLVVACGLTAVTVAFVGGIAFVGLVVPHMARMVVGPTHRGLVPCSAVLGAFLLVGSEWVCRVPLAGSGLRVGVVMSLIGAPFFLYLLFRLRKGRQL